MGYHTDNIQKHLASPAFLNGDEEAIDDFVRPWLKLQKAHTAGVQSFEDNDFPYSSELYAPYPYGFRPSHYGMIVIDFISQQIIAAQNFTYYDKLMFNAAAYFDADTGQVRPWSLQSRFHEELAAARAHKLIKSAVLYPTSSQMLDQLTSVGFDIQSGLNIFGEISPSAVLHGEDVYHNVETRLKAFYSSFKSPDHDRTFFGEHLAVDFAYFELDFAPMRYVDLGNATAISLKAMHDTLVELKLPLTEEDHRLWHALIQKERREESERQRAPAASNQESMI